MGIGRIGRVTPVLDEGSGRAGIGVVVPFDFVLDREYWDLLPDHVDLHFTRTPYVDSPVSKELAAIVSDEEVVVEGVRALVVADPDVSVYACTSGSFLRGVSGEHALCQAMKQAGARKALTTSGALLEALDVLGVRNVAVATPYDRPLTEKLVEFLAEAGVFVPSTSFLDLQGDISRVTPESVIELTMASDHDDAQAIFLSCTGLRSLEVVPELEARLDKPVLSANAVTMWAAARSFGAVPRPLDHRLYQASDRGAPQAAVTERG